MTDSPNCKICIGTQETIKHVLWSCPRAQRIWEYLKTQTRHYVGEDYISYNTILLGNNKPNMAMETLITLATRSILSIDRDEFVRSEIIDKKMINLFHYEKKSFGAKSKKLRARWGTLMNKFLTP